MGTRPRRTAELLVQETGSNDGEQSCVKHSPLCASGVRVSRIVALQHAELVLFCGEPISRFATLLWAVDDWLGPGLS